MRRVRALNKAGDLVKLQDAFEMTEALRHAFNYSCLNPACSCSFHWRKETRAKENTEVRPATFVKNSSSHHKTDCKYDYTAFVKNHREVAYIDGDNLNLRVQFPLGSTPSDLHPFKKGMLSDAQKISAHNNIDKRGFSSLKDLLEFLEEQFGSLEDHALDDVVLHYQGRKLPWNKLWVPSDYYNDLALRSQDGDKQSNRVITIVKPNHMGDRNKKGKRRFICRPQYTSIDSRTVEVKPVLVCATNFMASCFKRISEKEGLVAVASKPWLVQRQRKSELLVYFNVAKIEQLSQVNPEYWHRISGERHQMALAL